MRPKGGRSRTVKLTAGFTLIEVLAALTVTALVMVAVYPYFSLLISRWSMGFKPVQIQDQWLQAALRLSEDLAETVPLSLDPGGKPRLAFMLDPETVVFVRTGLDQASKNRLQTVTLKIAHSDNGDSLFRSASTFDPDRFPANSGSATSFLSGPFHLTFRYADATGDPGKTWTKGDELPEDVILQAESAGPNSGVPPLPIVMPLPARASPGQTLSNNGLPNTNGTNPAPTQSNPLALGAGNGSGITSSGQ